MVTGFDLTTLGLPRYMKTNATHDVFPTHRAGRLPRHRHGGLLDDGPPGRVHQFSGSITKTWRSQHQGRRRVSPQLAGLHAAGLPVGPLHLRRADHQPGPERRSSNQGNGLASMLLGWGNGVELPHRSEGVLALALLGFFVQDDWKVNRKLTINLGLRYDFEVPRWEAPEPLQLLGSRRASRRSRSRVQSRGVMKFVDDNTRSPFDTDWNNFARASASPMRRTTRPPSAPASACSTSLARHGIRPHRRGFTTDSPVPWSLDSSATRNATLDNPYPQGMLTPPGSSQGDRHVPRTGCGHHLARQPQPGDVFVELLHPARARLAVGSRSELHRQPRRAPVLPYTSLSPLDPQYWGHRPNSAASQPCRIRSTGSSPTSRPPT